MGLASRRLVRRLVRTVGAFDTITSGECHEDWFVLVCVCVVAGASVEYECILYNPIKIVYIARYRGADKSLARPTSRYILFDG